MSELRGLTGLRGVAAWLVVLYHIRLSIAGLPAVARDVLAKGYLAVDFFFLLSGFVIWLTWHERLRADGWAGVPRFWRKRVARIWPLHLFMMACAILLAGALAATGRVDATAYPVGELPLHLLLVQNWGFTTDLAWNDPAWSISCELAAYLLFPLLAMGTDWRARSTATLLAVAAAMLALLAWIMRDAPTLGWDIARFGLARCLVEFAVGGVIAALWLRRTRATAAIAACAALAGVGAWIAGLPEPLIIPATFGAALLAFACVDGANPLARPLPHYLGEVSYATYLGHFLLFQLFKLVLVKDAYAIPPHLIALYLVLVLASSIALYHLVERPAQRWINGGRRPRLAVAVAAE